MASEDFNRPKLGDVVSDVYNRLSENEKAEIDGLMYQLDIGITNRALFRKSIGIGSGKPHLGRIGKLEIIAALGLFLNGKESSKA